MTRRVRQEDALIINHQEDDEHKCNDCYTSIGDNQDIVIHIMRHPDGREKTICNHCYIYTTPKKGWIDDSLRGVCQQCGFTIDEHVDVYAWHAETCCIVCDKKGWLCEDCIASDSQVCNPPCKKMRQRDTRCRNACVTLVLSLKRRNVSKDCRSVIAKKVWQSHQNAVWE